MGKVPEEAVKSAERLPQAEKEITRYQQERERWINYTIDLQTIIEALCDQRGLPKPISTARHHYDMAREYLSSRAGNTVPALEPSAARELALEEAAQLIEANMLVGGEWPEEKIIPRSNPGNKVGFAYAAAIRALSSPDHAECCNGLTPEECADVPSRHCDGMSDHADAGKVEGDGWLPITEENEPPMDVEVILGWWQSFPEKAWITHVCWYGSTRGRWRHSGATHWLPLSILPSAPSQEVAGS